MQPEVDCDLEEGGGVTSLSKDLAQSQQEANELGESSTPSSPASTNARDLSDGSMVAAGGILPGLPAASLYCPCGSDAIDEDGICHGCGGRVAL